MKFALGLIFIALPILDIVSLIKAGAIWGFWPTLGVVVAAGILGTTIVRHQGFSIGRSVQQSLNAGRLPVIETFNGACVLAAGALLLFPGLLSDFLCDAAAAATRARPASPRLGVASLPPRGRLPPSTHFPPMSRSGPRPASKAGVRSSTASSRRLSRSQSMPRRRVCGHICRPEAGAPWRQHVNIPADCRQPLIRASEGRLVAGRRWRRDQISPAKGNTTMTARGLRVDSPASAERARRRKQYTAAARGKCAVCQRSALFEAPAAPQAFGQLQRQQPNISVKVDVQARGLDPGKPCLRGGLTDRIRM